MNLNSKKGMGLISDEPKHSNTDSDNKVTEQNMNVDEVKMKINKDRLEEEAAKRAAAANAAADNKNIPKHIQKSPKEPYYLRSYRMSGSNIDKMDALKSLIGSDFNFQINKALEYWFDNVHPEVKV